MSILSWNAAKVKNLTGWEIWLFIIARIIVGFGVGVLACRYFPRVAEPLGYPAVILGFILLLVAARGLARSR